MLANLREKSKAALSRIPRDALAVVLFVLASSASFGLGYLAGKGEGSSIAVFSAPDISTSTSGMVVASRGGTKYYRPWCSGASRITDTNKVWFPTEKEAQAQGYSAAAGCK